VILSDVIFNDTKHRTVSVTAELLLFLMVYTVYGVEWSDRHKLLSF